MSTDAPALPPDLEAGLRRLRLRAMRALSPELLVTAKTQRWKPEEFLRTLIEAEIASRDTSNAANRLKAASFPVTKTLEEFDVAASSVKAATFDYLSGLEWVRAKENLCLVGPAGTGKSHLLVALGHAAIEAGFKVRYFSAVELVETLYRGLADNSVGRVLEQILKADLILIDEIGFAPMDNTGAQLFFRLVAAAYERRSLGVASHWPFEEWGRFLPDHSTAVSLLDRLLHHNVLVVTKGTQTVIARHRLLGVLTSRFSPPGSRVGGRCRRGLVERDAQSDLDAPSGDANFVDDEAEQLLLLVEVEAVERGGGAVGERVDALTEPVVFRELSALVGQRVTLRVDVGTPGAELFGSTLELDEFDKPSLVEVGEASALVVCGVDLPLEAGELRVEQFVIGRGCAFGNGLFAGEEHLRPQQRVAHLFEHEGIELVGADVAFVAALVLAPGAQRVVIATVVVAVERAVAAADFVADHADPQAPQRTRPRSSQAPGSARRGLHCELSRLTRPAASKVSSAMMAGTAISTQSSRGRGTWREACPGRGSGTDSVLLKYTRPT